MNTRYRWMPSVLVGLFIVNAAFAAPTVKNGGFETDRFGNAPGYARVNGGAITAWTQVGAAGVCPSWTNAKNQTGPQLGFIDNGKIPEGKQVGFLQNVATLSQRVAGFEKGKRYVVKYYESARRHRAVPEDPRLEVTLGGQVVVLEHSVLPVDATDVFKKPYKIVVSSPFTAPKDGVSNLVFRTTVDGGVSVLIDKISVEEIFKTDKIAPTYTANSPLVLGRDLRVANPSFEADHYGKYPGYAGANGGITGWKFEGKAGLNPWWQKPEKLTGPRHPFSDNGRIPDGRQVAFIHGAGHLKQSISGFKAGRRYQVRYYENARWEHPNPNARTFPVLEVRLGGEVIVSPHSLSPSGERGVRSPFSEVESALFTPKKDGAYDIEFRTTEEGGVTVLIDLVTLSEVDGK